MLVLPEPGKRRPLGRLEQNIKLSDPLEVRLEIRRDQGAGWIRLAIDRPVGAQMHQEPLAMQGGPGIVGLLDLDQLAVASQEVFGGPEGRRADDESRSKPGVRSRKAETPMSVGCPSNTMTASASGVPRFHSLTIRG